MKYSTLPHVDKPVAKILFGTASGPMLAGEVCDDLLDAAVEAGFTTLDTARNYQQSEATLGRWMEKRGNRSQLVLLSKCAHHDVETGRHRVTPDDIREDLRQSLEALRTDFIDIYLLHRDDPTVEVGPIVETLNKLHAAGHIGAFGASNWEHTRIAKANAYAAANGLIPFTASSPYFGLANQVADTWGGGVSLAGPENATARAWYAMNNMPAIAYSSLGRGLFSGKVNPDNPATVENAMDQFAVKGYYSPENMEKLCRVRHMAQKKGCTVPQLAMAWLFCQPIKTFSVLGTTNPARFSEAIESLYIPLTMKELAYLDLAEN